MQKRTCKWDSDRKFAHLVLWGMTHHDIGPPSQAFGLDASGARSRVRVRSSRHVGQFVRVWRRSIGCP